VSRNRYQSTGLFIVKTISLPILVLASFSFGEVQFAFAQQEQALPIQKLIEVDGAKLDVDIWGAGDETIIALPGLGSDTARFQLLAPKLALAGYRVVSINRAKFDEARVRWKT
jgi:hypothetical protein